MTGARGGRIVIAGGGLAGASAALALRDHGFEGEIVMAGAEPQPAYNRPPLSKGYLRGEERFEDQLVLPSDRYAARGIETRWGTAVTAVDPHRHEVELEGGERLGYRRLLFATGGRNRRPPVPGAALEGVLQLRTVADADRIREAAARGGRAVVVGLGFVGSEVAASLRHLGLAVTAIEVAPVPLARVLGEQVGRVLAAVHRDHGVDLVLGDQVAAFEGSRRVERVRTAAGRVLDCDFVVAGVGIAPNSELLEAAGAAVENGVLVDERCRTSLPDVWAAGDVANHRHPLFGRVRVEHWNNAHRQGRAAAGLMLGVGAPYDYLHTFWSDQYEHTLEYAGHASRWDRLVVRGSLERRRFLAFYLLEGRLRAVVGLDRGGDPELDGDKGELKSLLPLIRGGGSVDARALSAG